MSIYKFKRVALASDCYQNILAKSKGDKKNQHVITLQIDGDHEDTFATLCEEIIDGVAGLKTKLGWADDAVVRLPFDLEKKTLTLSWREDRHTGKLRFWVQEPGMEQPIQIDHTGVPNIGPDSVVSVGLYVSTSASPATDKYKERIWINVEPEILVIWDVKRYTPDPKDIYKVEADLLETNGDF